MTDTEDLIRECQRGSALAWEALIRRFQDRVYAVSVNYLRNPEEARDATQEVFIRVYRNLASFRSEEASFASWVLAITRNTCIDLVRKRSARGGVHDSIGVADETHADGQGGPEERTSAGERRRALYEALDTLSETTREILLLKDIEGLKIDEVAKILSLPVGTVKSRANRARVQLAKLLAGSFADGTKPSGTG